MSGAPPAQAAIKGPAPVRGFPACGLRWNPAACAAEPASTNQNRNDLPAQSVSDDWSITTPGPMVEDTVTRFM